MNEKKVSSSMMENSQSSESSLSESDKLLYLIGECSDGHRLSGRKKLMKLVFFTEYLNISRDKLDSNRILDSFDFSIYKYGPFSRDVMDNFDELKEKGLISEDDHSMEHQIHLTNRGRERIREIEEQFEDDQREQIDGISSRFGEKSGAQLEDLSLKYLSIEKENKDEFRGMPIEAIIEEHHT